MVFALFISLEDNLDKLAARPISEVQRAQADDVWRLAVKDIMAVRKAVREMSQGGIVQAWVMNFRVCTAWKPERIAMQSCRMKLMQLALAYAGMAMISTLLHLRNSEWRSVARECSLKIRYILVVGDTLFPVGESPSADWHDGQIELRLPTCHIPHRDWWAFVDELVSCDCEMLPLLLAAQGGSEIADEEVNQAGRQETDLCEQPERESTRTKELLSDLNTASWKLRDALTSALSERDHQMRLDTVQRARAEAVRLHMAMFGRAGDDSTQAGSSHRDGDSVVSDDSFLGGDQFFR